MIDGKHPQLKHRKKSLESQRRVLLVWYVSMKERVTRCSKPELRGQKPCASFCSYGYAVYDRHAGAADAKPYPFVFVSLRGLGAIQRNQRNLQYWGMSGDLWGI